MLTKFCVCHFKYAACMLLLAENGRHIFIICAVVITIFVVKIPVVLMFTCFISVCLLAFAMASRRFVFAFVSFWHGFVD